MKAQSGSSKASKGSIGIESVNGRLRLNLPRQWFDGKQKRFALNLPDTPENCKTAELKAREIERDYALDNFDPTLSKYKPKAYLTPVTAITSVVPTPVELYDRYRENMKAKWKETTYLESESRAAVLRKLSKMPITDALDVKEALLTVTTDDYAKRVLKGLSAACEWGLEHGLVSGNPYKRIVKDLAPFKYEKDPKPNAFTPEERDRVIEAFKNDTRPGINYRHYAPFVEFLFLTGCRPSEAVGLRWKDVDLDKSVIKFAGGITVAGRGKKIRTEKSKNNKIRNFPYSSRLQALMTSLASSESQSDTLVFPSPKGGSIWLNNFATNAWKKVVEPIKQGTSPYSCRDTFITAQIAKGNSTDTIARWVDSSPTIIEKYYADAGKLTDLRPSD